MSGIDTDTSQYIVDAILKVCYLETIIQRSKPEAEQRNLVRLSAGGKTVVDDSVSVFRAISTHFI